MTPGKGDPFERAVAYARRARHHRAIAATEADPRVKRAHQRAAVQFEAAIRSTANGLIHLARIEAEPSDER